MGDIRKICGVTFLTSSLDESGALEVLYASGSNEGSTVSLGSSYTTIVDATLTVDTVSDVKVTFYPAPAYEESFGCALCQFSASFEGGLGAVSPEYTTFFACRYNVATAQSAVHVFEGVAAGTHKFYFNGKEINGNVVCNHWAETDTNAEGYDIIWAETLNRTKPAAIVDKITGVSVKNMAQLPILFASGTNTSETTLTDGGPPDPIVSASITTTSVSDLKVMFYPASVAETAGGKATYQFSSSHGVESPVFYGSRGVYNNTADTAAITWTLESLPANTYEITLLAEDVAGVTHMNGRADQATIAAAWLEDGTDVIYLETITRA